MDHGFSATQNQSPGNYALANWSPPERKALLIGLLFFGPKDTKEIERLVPTKKVGRRGERVGRGSGVLASGGFHRAVSIVHARRRRPMLSQQHRAPPCTLLPWFQSSTTTHKQLPAADRLQLSVWALALHRDQN